MLKLNDETKAIVDDIATLSGISPTIIKEVWEMTVFTYVERLLKNPRGRINLPIPYLGTIGVKYEGDEENADGSLSTHVSSFVALDSAFKSIIGDIVDENYTSLLDGMLKKKVSSILDITISEEKNLTN